MKKYLLILLLFIPALAWSASKPFILLPRTDVPQDDGNKVAQACFLRQHMQDHLNFVVAKILPRGEAELPELLKEQIVDGKKFHVAYANDFPDLYHFHLRYPNQMAFSDLNSFMDSKVYHLQYHSTEHYDLMIIQWLTQIRDLKDAATQEWAETRLLKATTPVNDTSFTHQASPTTPPLPQLDQAGMERLAALWDQKSGAQSPGLYYLMLRVRALNGLKGLDAVDEILHWRSVASHDDRFEVLPSLDLPNVWQPTDIFFAPIEKNTEIAQLIRDFTQRTGQTWVGNLEGNHGPWLPASQSLKEDSIATVDKILEVAKNDPDPLNTIKKMVVEDNPKFMAAFAVGEKFVFAIRYNLSYADCP